MKKLTFILAALALTLGLSQCKKTETPTTDEGVYITLTAGYGNGAKTDFTPATGSFVWTNGATEYIYVGGSNHDACLGVLSGTGTGTGSMTFSGTLTTTPDNGETLHFFYLGKGRDGSAVSSLDFSNQSIGTLASLTNFHIAVGDGSYSDNTVNYATTLHMAVSFAYFNVDGFKNASNATETVYLHGEEVYSTATINYRAGTITGDAKGNINLGTASSGKYVALIPSVNTETTLSFDSNSKWGAMNFMRGIQAGRYYSNGGAALSVTAGTLLAGTVPGLFSVSATKMVRFSKGNLQYQGSTQTWRFAENQYNFVGGVNESGFDPDHQQYGNVFEGEVQCKNELIAPDYSGWIDLFGWGTKNNPTTYVDGTYSWNEWGENAISNGGNTENSGWCTLTVGEWTWLVGSAMGSDPGTNCRISSTVNNTANARYTNAILNINSTSSVNGIILFPDDYTAGTPEGITWGPINEKSNWGTSCTISGWATLEAAGCVFLPASGYRTGISVGYANSRGMYWSSSNTGSDASFFVFYNDNVNPQNYGERRFGLSVRLIHNAGLIVNTDIINDVTAGGSIFSGWTNGGGDPWNDPTPGSGGSTLGGWNNEGNNPWGN